MAQMHFLNEATGWVPYAKVRTGNQAEANVYERGQEMIVVTWIRGRWTAMYANGNVSIARHSTRRGTALDELREARPDIAENN